MSSVSEALERLHKIADTPITVTGPSEISGEIAVQGSKNTANKLIAVTVALPGQYAISNFPFMLDALELLAIVEYLGGIVELDEGANIARIDTRQLENKSIGYEMTKTTTGAFGFAGALLGRFGNVRIGKPGGDAIGPRPVDLHSEGFRALGAQVEETDTELSAKLQQAPEGTDFHMRMPSVGAAVNYVMAVASAQGQARLENVTFDRDMTTMYELLRIAGVEIAEEENAIRIDARNAGERAEVIEFTCSPDRNEAFTCLAFGALSESGLTVTHLDAADLKSGIEVLTQVGVRIEQIDESTVRVKRPLADLVIPDNTVIVAGLSPLFHSDWAPLLEVVLTQLNGSVRVIDTLFSQRVRQVELLQQMGAKVTISGGQPPEGVKLQWRDDPEAARYIVDISGPSELHAIDAPVGYDVRADAALVLAASQAEGQSNLSEMKALYRGYEKVSERWTAIGITIE